MSKRWNLNASLSTSLTITLYLAGILQSPRASRVYPAPTIKIWGLRLLGFRAMSSDSTRAHVSSELMHQSVTSFGHQFSMMGATAHQGASSGLAQGKTCKKRVDPCSPEIDQCVSQHMLLAPSSCIAATAGPVFLSQGHPGLKMARTTLLDTSCIESFQTCCERRVQSPMNCPPMVFSRDQNLQHPLWVPHG